MNVSSDHDITHHFRVIHHVDHETEHISDRDLHYTNTLLTHFLSNRVVGKPFSCTVNRLFLIGATMGSVNNCRSSSCTIASTSSP